MRISDWSSDVCSSDLGSVPLGKLGAVRSMDQRHMGVYRLRPTHCANERELAEGVVEMVIAPDNMRNAHIVIVHHNGKHIGRRSIGAEQRSEEHTSELQSLMRISYAVFCLKKKKIKHTHK